MLRYINFCVFPQEMQVGPRPPQLHLLPRNPLAITRYFLTQHPLAQSPTPHSSYPARIPIGIPIRIPFRIPLRASHSESHSVVISILAQRIFTCHSSCDYYTAMITQDGYPLSPSLRLFLSLSLFLKGSPIFFPSTNLLSRSRSASPRNLRSS